jgi:hypothetical protein
MSHKTNVSGAERLARMCDGAEAVRWGKRVYARAERRQVEPWEIAEQVAEMFDPEPELIKFEAVDPDECDLEDVDDEYDDGLYWQYNCTCRRCLIHGDPAGCIRSPWNVFGPRQVGTWSAMFGMAMS